ncbi:hypothetical protein PROFUN_08336 [Planoprotostelium fungivorum]|uniref:Uncharacterized protein n=1 Tax=Planoprotostelium fungivorum TaxID=1890364 RepID=A0A2P6NI23_9EUKA|nr:hypothetical protein PROFUN_08336 [Planoprotostelium fungivorum]
MDSLFDTASQYGILLDTSAKKNVAEMFKSPEYKCVLWTNENTILCGARNKFSSTVLRGIMEYSLTIKRSILNPADFRTLKERRKKEIKSGAAVNKLRKNNEGNTIAAACGDDKIRVNVSKGEYTGSGYEYQKGSLGLDWRSLDHVWATSASGTINLIDVSNERVSQSKSLTSSESLGAVSQYPSDPDGHLKSPTFSDRTNTEHQAPVCDVSWRSDREFIAANRSKIFVRDVRKMDNDVKAVIDSRGKIRRWHLLMDVSDGIKCMNYWERLETVTYADVYGHITFHDLKSDQPFYLHSHSQYGSGITGIDIDTQGRMAICYENPESGWSGMSAFVYDVTSHTPTKNGPLSSGKKRVKGCLVSW